MFNRVWLRQTTVALGAIAVFGGPCLASAQTVEPDTASAEATTDVAARLGKVVVTAQRREDDLQRVPVAVTALTPEALEKRSVFDLRGIAATTPGLVIEQNVRSSMALTASLRGQSSSSAVITSDQSIGLYIDDVYRARSQGAITGLFDLSQVQVLRGVQGTLFGRNNTAGAILVSTRKPTFDAGVSLRTTLGNYNKKRFEGVVNLPVIDDKVAIRISALKDDQDGYLNNITNGFDGNSRDIFSIRGQILFSPTENWETVYSASYSDADQIPNTALPTAPGLGYSPPTGFYTAVGGAQAVDQLESQTHSLNTTIDWSDVSLKTVFAYHKQRIYTLSDSDGYPTTLLDVDLIEDQDQYTAEVQLTGDELGDRLEWLLGAYYFKEEGQSSSIIPALGRDNPGYAQNEATAGFAHLSYALSDKLKVAGGVRYTDEQRAIQSSFTIGGACGIDPSVLRAPGVCFADGDAGFNYWSWDANLNYQATSDVLLYARAGKGQKAGGFNNIINGATLNPFNPEVAEDIEVGVKAEWRDGTLRTNVALYQTDYSDIQRTQVVPDANGTPITRVDNAAAATIRGAEFEAVFAPTEKLTLSGRFAITDASYDAFFYNGVDVSGNEIAYVPKFTYSVSADYAIPLDIGELSLHGDWSYKDDQEFVVINRAGLGQDAYGLLNARASLTPRHNPNVRISIFGTNLTDEQYDVSAVELPFGYNVLYRGSPKMYGVEVALAFGGERTR